MPSAFIALSIKKQNDGVAHPDWAEPTADQQVSERRTRLDQDRAHKQKAEYMPQVGSAIAASSSARIPLHQMNTTY
jgi:hypothetical protein